MIREGDIGKKLFPDFPDMKVDFAEIGIGKIGKIGLAPPPPPNFNLIFWEVTIFDVFFDICLIINIQLDMEVLSFRLHTFKFYAHRERRDDDATAATNANDDATEGSRWSDSAAATTDTTKHAEHSGKGYLIMDRNCISFII